MRLESGQSERMKEKEKEKTCVLDGPEDQIQKLSKIYFRFNNKNVAEITHFNKNASFKGPSFHCQKRLDLKSM